MSFRVRRVGSFSVLVSCAALVAWGCSSNDKKVVLTPGEAGAGGEGGAFTPEAGAAGTLSVPSEAGQGGAVSVAGAAGAAGASDGGASEGGAAGGGNIAACTPSGTAGMLTIQNNADSALKVCRGAYARVSYTATTTTDQTFTCCGLSDTVAPYGTQAMGIYDGESGGRLSFLIPLDAALGSQSVTLTCNPGPVQNTANFVVTDTAPPVVTGATAILSDNNALTVTGSNLGLVTEIDAVSVDDPFNRPNCYIDPENPAAHTDTSIECSFSGISPGTYAVLVEQDDCGYAANQPTFTVPQPTR